MNSGEKGEGRIEEKTISNHNLFYTVDKLVTSAFKTNANITPNTTHTETHIHTHAHTHPHKDADTNPCILIQTYTCKHTSMYVYTHVYTYTHTLTHVPSYLIAYCLNLVTKEIQTWRRAYK